MPILVLASERWMRSMRTSRLATTVGDFVAREMAVLLGVVVECAVGVGLDVVDLVEVALADGLGLRPLVFGVLKGFAIGARLMVPSALKTSRSIVVSRWVPSPPGIAKRW